MIVLLGGGRGKTKLEYCEYCVLVLFWHMGDTCCVSFMLNKVKKAAATSRHLTSL